ncbi:MAG: ester cyclase [Haliea sp.]|uniref:ester cyclase n=1 Tax=Haliea sp. TaxID=1932666 RepID=UPI0032ECD708
MSSIRETAALFFDACESGQGWDACSRYCHPDASFSAQTDTFAGIDTLAEYTEAMKGLIAGPVPDASYEIRTFAVDEDRDQVLGFAIFRGTHTGDGGPVPPSGKAVETDYVYVMEFDRDRIRHMTKIWNDGYAMRQLGWGA